MKLFVCLILVFTCHVVSGAKTHGLFNDHDHDNNDCLSQTEFMNIFLSMDGNPRDNSLTVQEFYSGWNHYDLNDKSDVPFFFSELDRNHDVHITVDELHMEFREFDKNHDDCVTYDEFDDMWNAKFNF